MLKLSSNFLTGRSMAVPLLWILFVICVSCLSVILSCLFLAAMLSPAGKGLISWFSSMLCFLVFLSLSHITVCIELRIGRFLEAERTTQDGGPFNTGKVGVSLYSI